MLGKKSFLFIGMAIVVAILHCGSYAAQPALNFDIKKADALSAKFPINAHTSDGLPTIINPDGPPIIINLQLHFDGSGIINPNIYTRDTSVGCRALESATFDLWDNKKNVIFATFTYDPTENWCSTADAKDFLDGVGLYSDLTTDTANSNYRGGLIGDASFQDGNGTNWRCEKVGLFYASQKDSIGLSEDAWLLVSNIPNLTHNTWVGTVRDGTTTVSCHSTTDLSQTAVFNVKPDANSGMNNVQYNSLIWSRVQ